MILSQKYRSTDYTKTSNNKSSSKNLIMSQKQSKSRAVHNVNKRRLSMVLAISVRPTSNTSHLNSSPLSSKLTWLVISSVSRSMKPQISLNQKTIRIKNRRSLCLLIKPNSTSFHSLEVLFYPRRKTSMHLYRKTIILS